ncbi:hypothetical protein PFMALIP_04758 [Plasmodium falciparum MaliPS096_E11]|uniref:Uncharacterized protein n=1 Tax=Plasmodium falciparum MaliPS096_E11 TaxID=1036727 RepID=A0A024WJ21_PLAFA|nr:hypothetical protein PFMALIP_04758 [Plasmodium falciparum MaliPS096_E11]
MSNIDNYTENMSNTDDYIENITDTDNNKRNETNDTKDINNSFNNNTNENNYTKITTYHNKGNVKSYPLDKLHKHVKSIILENQVYKHNNESEHAYIDNKKNSLINSNIDDCTEPYSDVNKTYQYKNESIKNEIGTDMCNHTNDEKYVNEDNVGNLKKKKKNKKKKNKKNKNAQDCTTSEEVKNNVERNNEEEEIKKSNHINDTTKNEKDTHSDNNMKSVPNNKNKNKNQNKNMCTNMDHINMMNNIDCINMNKKNYMYNINNMNYMPNVNSKYENYRNYPYYPRASNLPYNNETMIRSSNAPSVQPFKKIINDNSMNSSNNHFREGSNVNSCTEENTGANNKEKIFVKSCDENIMKNYQHPENINTGEKNVSVQGGEECNENIESMNNNTKNVPEIFNTKKRKYKNKVGIKNMNDKEKTDNVNSKNYDNNGKNNIKDNGKMYIKLIKLIKRKHSTVVILA